MQVSTENGHVFCCDVRTDTPVFILKAHDDAIPGEQSSPFPTPTLPFLSRSFDDVVNDVWGFLYKWRFMVFKTTVCILTGLKCSVINVWNPQEVNWGTFYYSISDPQHKSSSQLIMCGVTNCVVDLWQVKPRVTSAIFCMIVAERDERSRQEGNLPPFVPVVSLVLIIICFLRSFLYL